MRKYVYNITASLFSAAVPDYFIFLFEEESRFFLSVRASAFSFMMPPRMCELTLDDWRF